MLKPVSRLVPSKLKRTLRSTFNTWADAHPLSDRVLQLEEKFAEALERSDQLAFQVRQLRNVVGFLQHGMLSLLPDVLRPSDAGRARIHRWLEQVGMDPKSICLDVSKNDIMFQFMVGLLQSEGCSVDAAFFEYMASGLHMYQVLEAIVNRRWGSFDGVGQCLDFASGCGRLTRFLVRAIPPKRLWVADIKSRAVEFQKKRFGVHGVVSTAEPEQFAIQERFDLIFVGSLFSHLPAAAFEGWLQRLWNLLTPTGLLAFTANDISLCRSTPDDSHVFECENEEGFTRSEDGALNPERYGNMYVSESFVRRILDRLPPAGARRGDRYPRGMWGVQDLYVVSRDGRDLGGIELPMLSNACDYPPAAEPPK